METLKISETLDEGSVMSGLDRAQNPCDKTLGEASGLSGLSENCSGLVLASEVSVRENGHRTDDFSGKDKVIGNMEVGKKVEGVEGGSLVAAVAGTVGNGKKCFNFGGIEKGSLVDKAVVEESHMKGGSLEPDFEGKRLKVPHCTEMKNGNETVREVCSIGYGNEEIGAEKVLPKAGVEEGDASQLNLVDSCKKVEVSGKGISLFVEVFGPLDGIVQGDDSNSLGERVLMGSSLNEENARKGNDTLFPDNGENTRVKFEGDTTVNQEFNVGEFVWAKTKNQSWWPGLIYDPSHAPKDAAMSDERDCLLVKHFGNGNFFWCASSQMKPFLEYFEQMSSQSNSRSFLGAVDDAVGEIGRRVKMEMTCSCFPKESRTKLAAETKEGDTVFKDKMVELGEFSVTRFEPAKFLAFVKDIARDVSAPGMIESTVTQNRLSAFCSSLGHLQLPMNQLRPTTSAKDGARDGLEKKDDDLDKPFGADRDVVLQRCGSDVADKGILSSGRASRSRNRKRKRDTDGDGGTDEKSEKGYESRERRKSKYLSPPYINLSLGRNSSLTLGEDEPEDLNNSPSKSMGSTPVVKSQGKKSEKKGSRKHITGHDKSSKPEVKVASSAEMLSDLRFTALDCLYLENENKCFDLFESFFLGFRKLVYREDIDREITKEHKADQDVRLLKTLLDVEVQTEKGKGKEEVTGEDSKVKGPNRSVRKKKGEKTSVGSKTKPTAGLFDIEESITKTGSVVIDFQKMKMGPLAPSGQPVPKKRRRKVGATPELLQFEVTAGLPDLNEKSNGLLLEESQVTAPVAPPQGKLEPKRKRKRKEGVASKSKSIGGMPNVEVGSRAKFVPVLKDVQVMGLYSPQSIPEMMSNREGLKEAAPLHLNTQPAANQPGGNGIWNNAEPSSFMKDHPQQMGILSPGGKPESKKRKRKEKATDCQTKVAPSLPDLNGNTVEPIVKELPETNSIPPEGKPKRKRRKKSDITVDHNGDALGTVLLLKFAPEVPLPSNEALVSTFCGFGQLNESETRVLNDSDTAQIAFTTNSDARDAFRSLEKSSPFGEALVNYRLHHLPPASLALEPDRNLKMPQFPPIEKPKPRMKPKAPPKPTTAAKPKAPAGPKTPAKPSPLKPQDGGAAPDLFCIRQNLEMMTSMLENAGDNLSPEMRAKLESEIKGLLKKVSIMVGSSSSS